MGWCLHFFDIPIFGNNMVPKILAETGEELGDQGALICSLQCTSHPAYHSRRCSCGDYGLFDLGCGAMVKGNKIYGIAGSRGVNFVSSLSATLDHQGLVVWG
ncbi:hypothetical protein ATANTOWER_027962 [Ataeniobius toweri]|uniref:Uncharacterized protein n=1 Tax=Ataeniobius toweri TaxID=208326 RepID=A0ABU7BKJ2_9TELE|nr:hypothetical protein [Ataeniobius toweri]